jgi:hypothetical protein
MVEIKARGAAKAEFTNVNEHFAATNNAEFGLFQQNLITSKPQLQNELECGFASDTEYFEETVRPTTQDHMH